MASIALIGPDGAGKTTLTRMLAESGLLRFKPIYMGIDVRASNVVLPSSRLAEKIKSRLGRRRGMPGAGANSATRQGRRLRHTGWVAARLVNRLADEWYRQSVSWWYQGLDTRSSTIGTSSSTSRSKWPAQRTRRWTVGSTAGVFAISIRGLAW